MQPTESTPKLREATRNGGHVVADVLERHGVRHVFGQDSPEWLAEALHPDRIRDGQDSPEWVAEALDRDRIRSVTMRDERSAGFAADAVARLTGRPVVAGGIHGPGALNLMSALLEARAACSPVIALVSGIETTTYGTGAFQETDQVAIARPLVKWATRVERPDRLEATVDRALRIATSGCPGPVFVELPNDVMEAEQPLAEATQREDAAQRMPLSATGSGGVAQLAQRLLNAERPAILAGNGARIAGGSAALVALAERLEAPVAVTAMGRGAFPETHRLFAGVAGFMSDREDGSGAVANRVLAETDALLVLGSALDGVTTDLGRVPYPGTALLRVDVDAERLACGPPAAVAIQGDAAAVTAALLDALPSSCSSRWGQLEERWEAVRAAQAQRGADAGTPIAPARLYRELQRVLDPEDIVVCDAAYSSVWALSYLQLGSHFAGIAYGRGAGTLGFGLPGAVGAAAAFPERRVVALVGDGGMGFGWGELETLARERLRVVCVVLNNSCFAYQKLWHTLNGGTSVGLDFADVRHDRLAAAVGLGGFLVERPEELAPALLAARELDTAAVIDVRIDPEALPPFNFDRHIGK